MLVLVLLMLAILLLAAAVVLYVADPHRGEDVPVAPWLGDAMQRGVDTVGDLLDRPSDEREHEHSH
jgi:hypothetical protein